MKPAPAPGARSRPDHARALGTPLDPAEWLGRPDDLASMRHGALRQRSRRRPRSIPFCRAWDVDNLYVVDGGFFPVLGRRQPGAHHRGAGAAGRRSHRAPPTGRACQPFRRQGGSHVRLHHHRRRPAGCVLARRLRDDPSVKVLLAGGRRARLASLHPHARRLRQDDQGHRELGLVDRAAEASRRPRALVHASEGARRRLLDQRADLHARQRARL